MIVLRTLASINRHMYSLPLKFRQTNNFAVTCMHKQIYSLSVSWGRHLSKQLRRPALGQTWTFSTQMVSECCYAVSRFPGVCLSALVCVCSRGCCVWLCHVSGRDGWFWQKSELVNISRNFDFFMICVAGLVWCGVNYILIELSRFQYPQRYFFLVLNNFSL